MISMLFTYLTQEDTLAAVDTLTESYANKWEAGNSVADSGPLIQTLASNDLIYIVLGVSLIIWFVLIAFLLRLDTKVGKLEQEVEQKAD